MRFNTQELIRALTGKNKAFIKRVAKQQEERYGNVDVFEAIIYPTQRDWYGEITKVQMQFGENWIDFYIAHNGDVVDTLGIGQGHRYHKSLEACAKELLSKYDFVGAR